MVKHKLFIVNIGKEEAWIEKYINQGYRLKSAEWGRYQFEKCENPYIAPKVKLDFRTFNKQEEFNDYLALFEDSGWRHIAGSKSSGVQYFEQMNVESADNIFSDNESKAGRYKRISNMWIGFFYIYFPLLIVFSTTGIFDFHKLYNLKELYYTPGLWEKAGGDFWRAFLFETPFALGRGFAGFLFLAIVLMYAYFGMKSLYWYRKEKDSKHHYTA